MSEGLVLQTVTALAEQTSQPLWLLRQYTALFTPSISTQPQFLTLEPRTPGPHEDQLENPVLVSREQGLGGVSPSKS